ncbi:DUF2171 domain-containing protein [Sphingomonas silueang]|uniref:DUF2171 domain-containing protein n=1 Tax=Sphingomonas silueang TaxID=3156617 RepID=UPI0032B31A80
MGYDRYTRNDDGSNNDRFRNDNRWNDRDDRSDRDRGYYGGSGGSYGYGGGSFRNDDRDGRDNYGRDRNYYGSNQRYGQDRDRGTSYGGYGQRDYGQRDYGQRDSSRGGYGQGDTYRGSYASDGHRFTDYRGDDRDQYRSRDRSDYRGDRRDRMEYDAEDRGFLARAGDEVRSWFGDEEAERRRERDQRYDEQMARYDDRTNDHAYRSWRDSQVSAFDRDYDEYRQENATRFQNEFTAFRTERQTQRDSLNRVKEHQEVVGSDGEHVGTVDKVRGDRIILTKNDVDAGGHHHSIPSRWVESVDDKVKLRKTKAEAQSAWRDEEQNQALFNDRGQSQQRSSYGSDRFGSSDDQSRERSRYGASATTGDALGAGTSTTAGTGIGGSTTGTTGSTTGTTGSTTGTTSGSDTNLNRSFSGTY